MKKIQTNQTKEKFYEKLNMEYQKERNHDKWHPCTHLIKKDGKYYVYYRSGKNVYKWSVQYLEDQQIIELQHVWNIADYVMWIPLAAMDVFFACFCVFNKLWQYIPVLCMVIAVIIYPPFKTPFIVYTCIMHGNCSTGISALLCVCGSFRRKCSDEVYNKLFGRQGSIEQILG